MSGSNWDLGIGARVEDLDWGASGDADDIFATHADDLIIADPRDVRRAETAPMVLTIMGADGTFSLDAMEDEKVDPDEEYRYTEEYHRLYYSKNPRDPRMLPPLTRRRHHLVREGRGAAETEAAGAAAVGGGGFAVTSGERTGVVGERVRAGEAAKASPGGTATATEAPSSTAAAAAATGNEATSSQALVAAYIDGFRSEWDYAKIQGHVRSFSKDQDGSRLVQRLLQRPENIAPIFAEVIPDFDELATDVFGNYVLQKLFDVVPGAEEDPAAPPAVREGRLLARLTEKVRGQLVRLSCQTYGCRVMQKALENVRAADRLPLIHELDGRVVECVFDQNANHVVQKVVEVCPADAQFIIDAFIPELGELACHAYGCRVLQRTFEKCHDVPSVNVRPLMEAVLARVNEFTIHQYGNYVVQHAMLNAPDDLRHRFVMQLAPQLYALSCSKFASNVAERIVTTANEEERDEVIKQLRKPLSDAQRGNYLIQMMQDTYANYVVQRLFEALSTAQRERVSGLVQPFVGTVNQSVYGRHLLRKMVANNILTDAFLRGHGIDVSSPEYGGNMGQGGQRGGGGGGSTLNGDRNGRHGSGANGRGNGAGGRGGARGGGHNGMHNGGRPAGATGAVVMMQPQQPQMAANLGPQAFAQPHPAMGGYMAAAAGPQQQQQQQQMAFGPAYNMAPQQQQQQPQQQQAFMGAGNGANTAQMPAASPYLAQMPSNNGQYNFSVYSTRPQMMQAPPQQQQQQLQQQQAYAMQGYSDPQQQQQQQQQPFRQDNAWTTQAFMNGAYGSADAAAQQQQLQNSYALPQQQQQQQAMFQNGGTFFAGAAAPPRGRSGREGEQSKTMKGGMGEPFIGAGAMDGAARMSDNFQQQQQQHANANGYARRSNYGGQRSPQQQQNGF